MNSYFDNYEKFKNIIEKKEYLIICFAIRKFYLNARNFFPYGQEYLLQESIYFYLSQYKSLKNSKYPLGYLKKSVENFLKRFIFKNQRKNEITQHSNPTSFSLIDLYSDLDAQLTETQIISKIDSICSNINSKERKAFYCYLKGMSIQQSGQIVGLSTTSTHRTIHKIKKVLRYARDQPS